MISWHYIFAPDNIWSGADYIVTQYSHPWQYLVRWGGDYIVTSYFHSWWYLVRGDYIVTLYFRSWRYLVRGWLYRDTIFSPLTIFGEGVIISWHHIFTPDNIWWGGDYIVTLCFHSWQYLVRGWLYRDIIFSLLTIFGVGVITLWHYIFTPDNNWWGGDYIVTSYFHFWQYFVRGWLYHDMIFSPLTIFGQGGDYIVTLYFHPWQYFVRGWLYHDMIFSPLTIFGQGGDYIVTLYFHFWQYLVRGWLYCDIIFSLLTIFGVGVIITWRYNIISDTTLESGTGGDYIWIFSLSKFDSAVIPGFYYSYPYIHPMKLGALKWLYLSMIPSLLFWWIY